MSIDTTLRILSLALALAGAEMLHGIARTVFLAPRIGKARAVKVSILSGSLIAFGVAYLLVPGIGLGAPWPLLALGLFLAFFMTSFDFLLGLYLLKKPWRKVLEDFDPRTGNYLLFGLIFLLFLPLLVDSL